MDEEFDSNYNHNKAESLEFENCFGFFDAEYLLEAETLLSEEIIARIEAHTLNLVLQIVHLKDYALEVPQRTKANSTDVRGLIRLGSGTSVLKWKRSYARLSQMWRVMSFVYSLLQEQKKATQREAFYCLLPSFSFQALLNERIQDVASLLGCSRACLNLAASPRGCVVGKLQVFDGEGWIDCRKAGLFGVQITSAFNSFTEMSSDARFIIVVEKEAIFQRLAEDRFYNLIPSILITGKGVPDLTTRQLVHRLATSLNIPVLGIFDYNPYGVAIWMMYRHGTLRMGAESYQLAVDIKWLGIHYNDILDLSADVLQPLTEKDKKKLGELLESPRIAENQKYRDQLEKMIQLNGKAEIEVLHSVGYGTLASRMSTKILRKQYLD